MITGGKDFRKRAETAINDPSIQEGLRRAMAAFRLLYENGLKDWTNREEMRDYARAAKIRVLSNLDHYLEMLADRVESAGGHVHFAKDAKEAREVIGRVAKEEGVERIVKSKSMVSEEIELTPYLENLGMKVSETDLGEYIIQLAGEHPFHILAPAIHKTREEIARLFAVKMGIEEKSDIHYLMHAARRSLRSAFLNADMGISGANFGIAETGSVTIVTNEGNGRYTTGIPRIHVALMSIEKTVATLKDLSIFLHLLARTSLGQPMSSYTSMVTGPKRRGDADGPEQFHLVILDNGRTGILGSQYSEILLCIRCSTCLNMCPIYNKIGGHAYGWIYPGPMGAVLTPLLRGLESFQDLPLASTMCGACRDFCPMKIDLPGMLLKLRQERIERGMASAAEKTAMSLWAGILKSRSAYEKVRAFASFLQPKLQKSGRLPGPLSGWTNQREFPLLAKDPFTLRWKRRKK